MGKRIVLLMVGALLLSITVSALYCDPVPISLNITANSSISETEFTVIGVLGNITPTYQGNLSGKIMKIQKIYNQTYKMFMLPVQETGSFYGNIMLGNDSCLVVIFVKEPTPEPVTSLTASKTKLEFDMDINQTRTVASIIKNGGDTIIHNLRVEWLTEYDWMTCNNLTVGILNPMETRRLEVSINTTNISENYENSVYIISDEKEIEIKIFLDMEENYEFKYKNVLRSLDILNVSYIDLKNTYNELNASSSLKHDSCDSCCPECSATDCVCSCESEKNEVANLNNRVNNLSARIDVFGGDLLLKEERILNLTHDLKDKEETIGDYLAVMKYSNCEIIGGMMSCGSSDFNRNTEEEENWDIMYLLGVVVLVFLVLRYHETIRGWIKGGKQNIKSKEESPQKEKPQEIMRGVREIMHSSKHDVGEHRGGGGGLRSVSSHEVIAEITQPHALSEITGVPEFLEKLPNELTEGDWDDMKLLFQKRLEKEKIKG